jgi:hypothetical protein
MKSNIKFLLTPALWTLAECTRSVLVVLLFFTGLNVAQAQAHPKPELARLDVLGDIVSANGIWRADNPDHEPLEAVTSLTCYRHGGKDIVGSDSWCLSASASSPDGMLNVYTEWLKVVEWSDTRIIATSDSTICLTSQTIIDLSSKTIIALDVRKPNASGLNGVCRTLQDRQTYYLQDQSDYYVHKGLQPDQHARRRTSPPAIEYCADSMTNAFCTGNSKYKCKEGADWHDTQAYRDSLQWCRDNSR